jgi:hypothetical protein
MRHHFRLIVQSFTMILFMQSIPVRLAVSLIAASWCLVGCNHPGNPPLASADSSSAPPTAAATVTFAPQEHQNSSGTTSSCSNMLLNKSDQYATYSVHENLCERGGKMEWQIRHNNVSAMYSLPADQAEAIGRTSAKYWGDGLITIDLPEERGGTVIIAKWSGDKWLLQNVHYTTGDDESLVLEYEKHVLRMTDTHRSGVQIYPGIEQDVRSDIQGTNASGVAQGDMAEGDVTMFNETEVDTRTATTPFGKLSSNDDGVLLLNGKVVEPKIEGNNSLSFVAQVTFEHQHAVLIQDNGGTACPTLYYWIVSSDGSFTVSPEFGSCSRASRVSTSRGKLVVAMPGFMGDDAPEAAKKRAERQQITYVYDGKGVSEDGKPLGVLPN